MDFRGMSYEQASRHAGVLIEKAHKSGRWFDLVEQLSELRTIMRRGLDGMLAGSWPAPAPPLPDWATRNTALRNARDAMDAVKKDEQQAEMQRQHAYSIAALCGPWGDCRLALRTGQQQ